MVLTRYALAAANAPGRDVLEVGAGAGLALGWYAKQGKRVVGTDFTPSLVREARATYGARVDLAANDAQAVPFRDESFDLVVFFEALYYLPNAARFFREARRVLRPDGRILLCTANKHRPGFVKSPYSHTYLDGDELRSALAAEGFTDIKIQAGFPATPPDLKQRIILAGFSAADQLRLIPRTLEGRAKFKRLLYGDLATLPRELTPTNEGVEPLADWNRSQRDQWKVIYALATKEDQS